MATDNDINDDPSGMRLEVGAVEIPKGASMRTFLAFLALCALLTSVGCTTTPEKERPKILCPACGTELDSIFHKRF
jgi:hypothetical protein